MSQISFQFRQMAQRMWFLPAAFSLGAIVTILIAYYGAQYAPAADKLPFTVPSNSVVSILTILASSLLTVSVFALSTMVSALASASQSTTPRAVPLIVGDRSAQTSISIFIGAFLFSVVGIIGLSSGIYSEAGRLLLFAVTIVVVVLVIAALIRWIGQISAIGRVTETIDRVEAATTKAFDALSNRQLFGCSVLRGEPSGVPLVADKIGYVQHIDVSKLQRVADEHELQIAIVSRPGAYAAPNWPLMVVMGEVDDETRERLVNAFVIGDSRTFESDPRYGLITLSEIAGKALSPGINDPGTAIDVIGTLVRILAAHKEDDGPRAVKYVRLSVAALEPAELLEDAFRSIARDGAASVEVVLRLLAGLETIAAGEPEYAEVALVTARDAAERARAALTAKSDLAALERAAAFAQ
ncbi:DUF2254 domain-containing protein [Devosia algicola]|uniref:DUF2254 domain-containing protein n=1 Tax=Devosia algicola TaxID=3026418 RepID=A0ABY7YPC6_9HYPH|nr:DUF2254 domain-containing protein [Devosia algicola]WDR02745.1 DUF2254 domain-containing protein [Devosia algicola]